MSIRNQFTIFSNSANSAEPEFVYLDNAATTQKPDVVINTITEFYQSQNATVHRGTYSSANQATSRYEQARSNIAKFIGANDQTNIVWTKGTTESINLVAYAWGEINIHSGDDIMILGSEHHANYVPWQQLALRKGAKFNVVDVLPNGDVDLADFNRLLQKKPKLVALQHCSNALGNIHPIEQLCALAKKAGARVLVDGAQAVAHLSVDVEQIGCDFYAFSGHKMYGPTGIGVLYVNHHVKAEIRPFHFGGEMIQHVSQKHTSFREIPAMLESGTPNISGVLGLNAAVEFMQSKSASASLKHTESLYRYLIKQLSAIEQVRIIGNTDNNIGVASFVVENESVSDIGAMLNEQNVAVRCGHHCAMPLMQSLNLDGTVRVSLAVYNTEKDVDLFINALNKTLDLLTF